MNITIPNYEILRELGEGGMSVVFLCRHKVLDQLVAVKVLHRHFTKRSDIKNRFISEAKLMSQLKHPNIVRVLDFLEFSDRIGFVMEYVEGKPLDELIGQEYGPIPHERALPIFRQVLEGMSYAHAHGVVHRDLKPSNVIVTDDGTAKITDFGIAKLVGEKSHTQTGAKMGTLYYMSPEQIRDTKGVDYRSDIYSLGMTLYEMLAGRLPFDQGEDTSEFEVMNAITGRHIPPPSEFYPHVPKWLETIVLKSLALKPADRFESCDDFLNAIARHEDQSLKFREKSPLGDRPKKGRLIKGWLMAGAGVALVLGLILIPRLPNSGNTDSTDNYTSTNEETDISDVLQELPEGMEFVRIAPGSFMMGSLESQLGYQENELPQHEVVIQPFEIMTTEVTQKMWWEVMGKSIEDMQRMAGASGDLDGIGDNIPMYYISWNDCCEFIDKLNEIDDGYTYRLPSEAEWEYAVRAGTETRFYWGDDPLTDVGYSELMSDYAYYNSNTALYRGEHGILPVAELTPNEWGLYDMNGSVEEICEDNWHENYVGAPSDGSAWLVSDESDSLHDYRVLRGGHYLSYPSGCRSANRRRIPNSVRSAVAGVRIVRVGSR